MTTGTLSRPTSRVSAVTVLCSAAALLMVVSGAIHLHLWDKYYRHVTIGHMNVAFLVQLSAAFLGAIALVVWRALLIVVASAALMAGTAVGYLIARYRTAGLFGFSLGPHFSSPYATWALVVEVVATALLIVAAAILVRARAASAPAV